VNNWKQLCSLCIKRRIHKIVSHQEDLPKDPSMDKIDDNLYLGNRYASMNLKILLDNGITHIMVCGSYLL